MKFPLKLKSISFLFILISLSLWAYSIPDPILFVQDSHEAGGKTFLSLIVPGSSAPLRITEDFFRISFPRVCAATGRIGFTHHTQQMRSEIYLIEPNETKPKKIMDNAILEDFSPDGRYILYSAGGAAPSLFQKDLQSGQVRQLTQGQAVSSARWSPNGDTIGYSVLTSGGTNDIYLLQVRDLTTKPLTQTPQIDEFYPLFNHDGRFIAFMSNRTGIWRMEYMDLVEGGHYQSNIQGMYPELSADDEWTVVERSNHIVVSLTSGAEEKVLIAGITPTWIASAAAVRFTGKGIPTDRLAEQTVGPQGGTIGKAGVVQVTIPQGFVDAPERFTIDSASSDLLSGQFFSFQREKDVPVFPQMVEISIIVDPSIDASKIYAVEEINPGLWWVVPSQFDSRSRTLSFQTAHFSKKGFISEISASDVRKVFSSAVGGVTTAGVIIIATGSTAITLPVLGAVAAGSLIFGATEVANPLLDRAYQLYYGLNQSVALGDRFYISWVDNPSHENHLSGSRVLVCIDQKTKKILYMMDDPNLSKEQRIHAMSALFPLAQVELINIPKIIFTLAGEAQWTKHYFEHHKYSVPPSTDIWIYKMPMAGSWDGTKLNVALDYLTNPSEQTTASRRVTFAHEYWHSVYHHNGFKPSYPWLDECLATTFESEVLTDAKKVYDQKILPDYEQFYSMYPADRVALSLRTGLVLDGSEGVDADRTKRGYHLWSFGKFLIHEKGHDAVRSLLNNTMTAPVLSETFSSFAHSILLEERALSDDLTVSITQDQSFMDYRVKSGWPSLTLNAMMAPMIKSLGSSSAAIGGGVLIKPQPLSIHLMRFRDAAPEAPSPLIIRRNQIDSQEEVIALHPQKMDPLTQRRAQSDVIIGEGIVVVPKEWIASFSNQPVTIPLALVHKRTSQTWSEYFGYGNNPLWAYYLAPPKNLQLTPSQQQLTLRWNPPDFGVGLSSELVLTGYRLYVQKGTSDPIPLSLALVDPKQQTIQIPTVLVQNYDRLGLASQDIAAKDERGQPLESAIAWVDIHSSKGVWILQSQEFGFIFGKDLWDAETGGSANAVYEDGCFEYKLNMTPSGAKTTVTITASAWNCPYWSRKGEISQFNHTWTSLPERLEPGQAISITLGVSNDGSKGNYSPRFTARTAFKVTHLYEQAEAGGTLGRTQGSLTWVDRRENTFVWNVPAPDPSVLSQPNRHPLVIEILITNEGEGKLQGSMVLQYIYRE